MINIIQKSLKFSFSISPRISEDKLKKAINPWKSVHWDLLRNVSLWGWMGLIE